MLMLMLMLMLIIYTDVHTVNKFKCCVFFLISEVQMDYKSAHEGNTRVIGEGSEDPMDTVALEEKTENVSFSQDTLSSCSCSSQSFLELEPLQVNQGTLLSFKELQTGGSCWGVCHSVHCCYAISLSIPFLYCSHTQFNTTSEKITFKFN